MICRIFKRPSGLQKEHDRIREVRHGVGHASEGPESTRWGLCGLGVGAGMALVNCVFLAWKMTQRARERECAFPWRSLNVGTCAPTPHKDGICRPQLEPSSDVRIILPLHTWTCFSLNYNCFLHNEKSAQE